MNRRRFLSSAIGTASALPGQPQNYSDYSKDPRPDVAEGTFTAGSAPGPVFAGAPVVMGPAPESITILQPLQRCAAGYLEFAIEKGAFERVDVDQAGIRSFSEHVLKVRLLPLPPGKVIRYRLTGWTVGWVKVRQFYHGDLTIGMRETTPEYQFRTLDPGAESTRFAVWNDTHEDSETLRTLHRLTTDVDPDFLLWNGDQSNDVHFERDMSRQFLQPEGLAIAHSRPLAYARGNHDIRGPAAQSLVDFTGTPEDRFYYGFRSGPLAALVMDTGEDKPDDSPIFRGMAAFQTMQKRQAEWLRKAVREPWFRTAPHKVLFCHIPLWFTRDIFPAEKRWECHDICRALWTPTLVKAGVKLVVSGHTHDSRWMPAKAGQPIAQLIGGGPAPRSATFIEGTATRDTLKVTMRNLQGAVLHEISLS